MVAVSLRQKLDIRDIPFEIGELTADEKRLAKTAAENIAQITATIGTAPNRRLRPGTFGACLRDKFSGVDEKTVAAITANAESLISRRARNRRPAVAIDDIDPALKKRLRTMFAKRLQQIRPQISATIADAARQAGSIEPDVPRTGVEFRPAGSESIAGWRTYTQIAEPEAFVFRWNCTDPNAGRAFYELRGPVGPGNPGKLLARGYLVDDQAKPGLGNTFEINLRKYLAPIAPLSPERYHVRILPLAPAPRGPTIEPFYNPGIGGLQPLGDVSPPPGVGPWSEPAVIDYGIGYRPEPTVFDDIETRSFYRKGKFSLDWFKVDTDQPGDGDEEYNLRAFLIEINPRFTTDHGRYGAFLKITEGDTSKHDLGWVDHVDMGDPFTNPNFFNEWPRMFLTGMSVLETDGGAELSEWYAMITEIFNEIMTGDIHDEIRDAIDEARAEVDDATADFRREVAATVIIAVMTAIGSVMAKVAALWILAVVAVIGAFIGIGSRDDFYGFHLYTLMLASNDPDQLAEASANPDVDAPAARVLNHPIAAAGGTFEGAEQNGRFRLVPTEIQLTNIDTGDSAGTGGKVRFGLRWELYDKVTLNF